jgi:hypothetical protein
MRNIYRNSGQPLNGVSSLAFTSTEAINRFFPASGPATGSFNGLHSKNKFLAVSNQSVWTTAHIAAIAKC